MHNDIQRRRVVDILLHRWGVPRGYWVSEPLLHPQPVYPEYGRNAACEVVIFDVSLIGLCMTRHAALEQYETASSISIECWGRIDAVSSQRSRTNVLRCNVMFKVASVTSEVYLSVSTHIRCTVRAHLLEGSTKARKRAYLPRS